MPDHNEKRKITTDDVEDMPHLVILRTHGKVKRVEEFKTGTLAHEFATQSAIDDAAGEIIVCVRVRTLERFDHRDSPRRN